MGGNLSKNAFKNTFHRAFVTRRINTPRFLFIVLQNYNNQYWRDNLFPELLVHWSNPADKKYANNLLTSIVDSLPVDMLKNYDINTPDQTERKTLLMIFAKKLSILTVDSKIAKYIRLCDKLLETLSPIKNGLDYLIQHIIKSQTLKINIKKYLLKKWCTPEIYNSMPPHRREKADLILSSPVTPSEEQPHTECCVCLDHAPDVRFVICGHVNTCNWCYPKLTEPRKCPICRASAEFVETVGVVAAVTPEDVVVLC